MVAILVASLVGATLSAVMSPEQLDAYGWRIAFGLGGVALPLAIWLRARLPETLHVAKAEQCEAPASRRVQAGRHVRLIIIATLVFGMGAIASYINMYAVTYAQGSLKLSAGEGFIAESAAAVAAMFAIMFGGWLSDRIGRRPVNIFGNLLLVLCIYPVFAWIVAQPTLMVLTVGMMVYSAISNVIFAPISATMIESLPAEIRSAGFGTAYSVAVALFGGSTQLVLTWLIHITGSGMMPAWYALGAALIAQVGIMMLPERAPFRRKRAAAGARGAHEDEGEIACQAVQRPS